MATTTQEYNLFNGPVTVEYNDVSSEYVVSIHRWSTFRGSYIQTEHFNTHAEYFQRMAELSQH